MLGEGPLESDSEEAAWRKGLRSLINSQGLWVVSYGLVLKPNLSLSNGNWGGGVWKGLSLVWPSVSPAPTFSMDIKNFPLKRALSAISTLDTPPPPGRFPRSMAVGGAHVLGLAMGINLGPATC